MSLGPRSWRVFCVAANDKAVETKHGFGYCQWKGGTRTADTQEQATLKPCPQCGGPVVAVR